MNSYNQIDFSEQRLRNLYRYSKKNGYLDIFFGEEKKVNKPFILWRHDVDIELPAVKKMAKIEYEEGIKSTYFFMTNSWFYNIFSIEGRETINLVKRLGHRVGLHCDLEVIRDKKVKNDYVIDKVEKDFSLLSVMYPDTFDKVVSFHNPPSSILGKNYKGFYSTYNESFFKEIKYLSDSNRIWREGSPESWFNIDSNSKLSILLHPIIWAYPGVTMADAMNAFIKSKNNKIFKKLEEDDIYI
ncbi:hypothetical protein LC040_15165 [Bacillus tianshenii]|nr:hypothetical protein LC040_15165 [Bacillus tianshenii]